MVNTIKVEKKSRDVIGSKGAKGSEHCRHSKGGKERRDDRDSKRWLTQLTL